MTKPTVVTWLAFAVAILIGTLPYAAALRCPICLRHWAVWPIRGRLNRWVLVCHRDFTAHRRRTP